MKRGGRGNHEIGERRGNEELSWFKRIREMTLQHSSFAYFVDFAVLLLTFIFRSLLATTRLFREVSRCDVGVFRRAEFRGSLRF